MSVVLAVYVHIIGAIHYSEDARNGRRRTEDGGRDTNARTDPQSRILHMPALPYSKVTVWSCIWLALNYTTWTYFSSILPCTHRN